MNVPSLLLLPDRSTGQLQLEGLSDQMIMECFAQTLGFSMQKWFRNADRTYKDVCKWKGVKCKGRGRVDKIIWTDAFPGFYSYGGFPFYPLPPTLKVFHMSDYSGKKQFRIKTWIDTSELPRSLEELTVRRQYCSGTFDLRHLPPDLRILDIGHNKEIEGAAYFHALPKRLKYLSIRDNDFTGKAFLNNLPRSLNLFDAAWNRLHGSVNLACLPKGLEEIDLSYNLFSGSVYLENLPREMTHLRLNRNTFCGEVRLQRPSPYIEVVDLQKNHFEGEAIIAGAAQNFVNLDQNAIQWVRDENGKRKAYVEKYPDDYSDDDDDDY